MKYELDPYNRLIEHRIGRRGAVLGLRRVLDGTFKAHGAELVYRLKEPVPEGAGALRELVFKGSWSLSTDHELVFTLEREWRKKMGAARLVFRGELVEAKANSLIFSIGTRSSSGMDSFYLLSFEGAWQADERNRLVFKIKEENGVPGALVFDGAWEVDKKHRLLYRYEVSRGIRKEKRLSVFAFEGRWDISQRLRLSYLLGSGTDCRFDFKASLAQFSGRQIKYEIGIRLSSRRQPVKRLIVFEGKWLVTERLGLVFEVPGTGGSNQVFSFGCLVKLSARNMLVCSLRNRDNRSLGVEIKLERSILEGEGKVFLRAIEEKGSAAITVGAGFGF